MIALPPGFDVVLLFSDFFTAAVPFAGLMFLIGSGYLVIKLLKRV